MHQNNTTQPSSITPCLHTANLRCCTGQQIQTRYQSINLSRGFYNGSARLCSRRRENPSRAPCDYPYYLRALRRLEPRVLLIGSYRRCAQVIASCASREREPEVFSGVGRTLSWRHVTFGTGLLFVRQLRAEWGAVWNVDSIRCLRILWVPGGGSLSSAVRGGFDLWGGGGIGLFGVFRVWGVISGGAGIGSEGVFYDWVEDTIDFSIYPCINQCRLVWLLVDVDCIQGDWSWLQKSLSDGWFREWFSPNMIHACTQFMKPIATMG